MALDGLHRLADAIKKTPEAIATEAKINEVLEKLKKLQDTVVTDDELKQIKEDLKDAYLKASISAKTAIDDALLAIKKEKDATVKAIKADVQASVDNVTLAFMDLEASYETTKKETQMMMEEKLIAFGEFAGEKINAAAQFIGTKTKEAINGALDYVASKISMISTNLSALTGAVKAGFAKLKNAIMHPIEFVKALPGKIIAGIGWALNKLKQGLVWAVKAAYSLVVGTIKYAMLGVVKLVKGLMWAMGKVIQGVFWVVKQAFILVYKVVTKVLSFVVGVIWGAIKTLGKFLFTLVWQTVKTIAIGVAKVAWVLAKTLVQTIVTAIMTAFAPWIGILALIGIGIYLLGRFFGWWGGDKNTKPGTPEKGGFFSGIFDYFIDKMGDWWNAIVGYFWNDKGDGLIQKGIALLWNDKGDGWIQKFFGITGDFFKWIWEKLVSFWDWVMKGDQTSNPFEIQKEQQEKIQKSLDVINDRQVELQKKSKTYTDELTKLNEAGPLSVEQQKRKSDLERALIAIREEIGEQGAKRAPLYKQLGESKAAASAKAQQLSPAFKDLMKNKDIGLLVKIAMLGNTEGLETGKSALSQEAINAMMSKLNADVGLAKSPDEKQRVLDAIKALQEYEDKAKNISGRKEGLIGKIWEALSGWWVETASPWLSKWIFGDKTDPNDTGGLVGWLRTKWDVVINKISEWVFGKGGTFDAPTGGILGGLYEMVFGSKTRNWDTQTGLWGHIKSFMYLNVVAPILDFIANQIMGSIKTLLNTVGQYLFSIGAKETGNMFSDAAETVGSGMESLGMVSSSFKATGSAAKIAQLEKSKSDIGLDTSLTQEQKDAKLSAINAQLSGLMRLNRESTAASNPALLQEKNLLKSKLMESVESLSRYLVSFGMYGPNRSYYRAGRTRELLGEHLFNTWSGVGKFYDDSWIVQKFGMGVTKDMEAFSYYATPSDFYNRQQIARNDFSKAKEMGIIGDKEIKNLESLLNVTNWNRRLSNDLYADYLKTLTVKDKSPTYEEWIKNEWSTVIETPQWLKNMQGAGRTGDKPEDIAKEIGLAYGGIIKPVPMGRSITVAEAGDPEIILPLNKQGIDFIKELSDKIQSSESSGVMEQLLTAIAKTNKAEEASAGPRARTLPAMNVGRSDKVELDLLKLVSLGVLSK